MKPYSFSCPGIRRAVLTSALGFAISLAAVPASAQTGFYRQLSQDSFTDPAAQHMTEVEPGAFAYRSTVVTAFQVARISSGGGDDIGFATTLNGGTTWTNGYLPGLTTYGGGGTNSAASDPSVAYDVKHGVWLINTLPIAGGVNVAVSRSTDGIHWGNPIYITQAGDADKNWINCDNTATSPYYGNCYVGWDNSQIQMTTSSDGGVTWGPAKATAAGDFGIGVNPVVQPHGTVVVGFADFSGGMSAFTSSNGGQSWNAAVRISTAPSHGEAGGLRSAGLPSTAIDGAGKIYVSWPDCRFRSGCASNDIVYSTSTDGTHWSSVVRVPIDPVTSTVDHFIHGMGIDIRTSGSSAHMGITYYYYPVSACGSSCRLYVGFTLSNDGGQTWTAGRQLSGPMQLSWLPNTFSGRMVADYVATVYPLGTTVVARALPIFAMAFTPTGSLFQQAIYTEAFGFSVDEMTEQRMSSKDDLPIPGAKSDHPARRPEDRDNELPAQPSNTPPAE